MKKLIHVALIVMILSLAMASTAFASAGEPAGGCAPAFELHEIMDHSGDPMHTHIGADKDLNGDGFICVKHLSPDKHLHVDNSIPL
jgi:hypothetical protein